MADPRREPSGKGRGMDIGEEAVVVAAVRGLKLPLGLDRAKAVQAKALALQEAYSNLEQHLAEILGVLSVVVLVAQHMVAPLEERTPALNVPTPCRLRSSDLERARMGGRIPDTVGLLLAWDLVHEPLTLILVALPD